MPPAEAVASAALAVVDGDATTLPLAAPPVPLVLAVFDALGARDGDAPPDAVPASPDGDTDCDTLSVADGEGLRDAGPVGVGEAADEAVGAAEPDGSRAHTTVPSVQSANPAGQSDAPG